MIEERVEGSYAPQQVTQSDLKLTREAKECLRKNPGGFREQFGDYYICGFQRRYSFRAIVNCK
jgi:hypothetical protein